ncbi:hypothetical protein HYT58_00270 [Candidatus Woesearchaeota archaeon]|nr:hypothetical protein [Candidatus Woesearchaeota archaeon]
MLKESIIRVYNNLKEEADVIKKDMSAFITSSNIQHLENSLPAYKPNKNILGYEVFKNKVDTILSDIRERRKNSKETIQNLDNMKKRLTKIEKMLPVYQKMLHKQQGSQRGNHLQEFLYLADKYRTNKPTIKQPLFKIKENPPKMKNIMHDFNKDLLMEHLPHPDYIKDVEQAAKIFKEKEPVIELITKIKPQKIKSVNFTDNEIREFNSLAQRTYSRIKKKALKEATNDYNALNTIYTAILDKVNDYHKSSLYAVMHDLYDKLTILKIKKDLIESTKI